MRVPAPEGLLEGLAVIVYTVLATVFTAAGIFVEYLSLQHAGTGEVLLAGWFAVVGGLLLYAGLYGFGYQKVLSRVFTT